MDTMGIQRYNRFRGQGSSQEREHIDGVSSPHAESKRIVVDGDPLVDISVLQERANIVSVYEGGQAAPRLPF